MLKTSIHSQQNGNALLINEDGSINTFVIPKHPAIDQIALPFSQYLTIDGTELTSSSMLVDGSTNNVDFFIGAKSFDIYINTLVFSIVDANASMSGFGNLAALTNGLEFFYFNQANGKYTIESGLKSNFDMVRLANFEPSYGTGTAAMQLSNVIGTSEAYVGVIDIEDIFGLQFGLKLRANSTDRIGFIVKDNISALDGMDIKCYGIRL